MCGRNVAKLGSCGVLGMVCIGGVLVGTFKVYKIMGSTTHSREMNGDTTKLDVWVWTLKFKMGDLLSP